VFVIKKVQKFDVNNKKENKMSIITKPNQINKGQKAELQLNKSELAELVVDSAYYSDIENWNRVVLVYKSVPGNQKRQVVFDATEGEPIGSFFATLKAKDLFEVQFITIYDFDGGYYVIERESLDQESLDINLSSETNGGGDNGGGDNGGGEDYVVWDSFDPNGNSYTLGENGFIASASNENYAVASLGFNGNFEIEYTFLDVEKGPDFTAGILNAPHGSEQFNPNQFMGFYQASVFDRGQSAPLSELTSINTLNIKRVGSLVTIILNDTEPSYSAVYEGTVHPAVRLQGTIRTAVILSGETGDSGDNGSGETSDGEPVAWNFLDNESYEAFGSSGGVISKVTEPVTVTSNPIPYSDLTLTFSFDGVFQDGTSISIKTENEFNPEILNRDVVSMVDGQLLIWGVSGLITPSETENTFILKIQSGCYAVFYNGVEYGLGCYSLPSLITPKLVLANMQKVNFAVKNNL
jgi:hypothetical protein